LPSYEPAAWSAGNIETAFNPDLQPAGADTGKAHITFGVAKDAAVGLEIAGNHAIPGDGDRSKLSQLPHVQPVEGAFEMEVFSISRVPAVRLF
jgi:hypothetical protein